MYVYGGDTGSGGKTGLLEIYDLQGDSWVSGSFPAMGASRSHFGHTALDGILYAFGGEGAGGAALSSAEQYDPSRNTWSSVAGLPFALKGALCLCESGRCLLFGGERSNGRMSDQILCFDPRENRWRILDTVLPFGARDMSGCVTRHSWSHAGTTMEEEFCLIGGGYDGTTLRSDFRRFYLR